MKNTLVLLLLSSLVAFSTALLSFGGGGGGGGVLPPSLAFSSRQQKRGRHLLQQQQQHEALLLSIRGGANNSESVVVTKLQNVVRSLLEFLEKKLPILASLLKMFFKVMEKITGLSLLPKPKRKKKKKLHHSKKSIKAKTTSDKEKVDEQASKTKKSTFATSKPKKKKKKSSTSSNKHLSKKLSSKSPNYRIQKELKEFMQNPPPNLRVKVGSNIRVWIVEMQGASGSIYEGESFRLRVSFPPSYPTVPPSVYFLPPTPQHEHVYTNGDICLSLLGKGWQPQMTAQSIAVSILSILTSAQSKSLPMDNARHSQNKPGQYQKDWVYHDDNC